MRKKVFRLSVLGVSAVALAALVFSGTTSGLSGVAYAQQNQNRATDSELHVLPVQGNIYMIVGAGSNITLSVGFDGTMLVDTGSAQNADKVLAVMKQVANMVSAQAYPPSPCVGIRCPGGAGSGAFSQWGWTSPEINEFIASPAPPKPLRYIINTSVDPDHTGGNVKIMSAGATFTGGNVSRGVGGGSEGASIWAFENVLNRMTESKVPDAAWPTDTFYTDTYKWNGFFNGEGIQLYHTAAAHTDGDIMAYFRYSDVISAGDVLRMDTYPVIDTEKGGTIQGELDALNKILDIAIPQFRAQGGTYIIPGHGRLADFGDVANYRNMVFKIRDRIQDLIKSGMTLQQVKAAKPTLDYDGRYGSPDAFIEAAYKSLSKK
jgi:glyoxylase-like metal-dependent hydrolase (beta-lactamase superfamily II)